MMVEIV